MLKAQDFVEAHLYNSEEDVIQDALRHLLRGRPELRIQLAIHRYQTEKLSLAKAASLAGVGWAQMKDILLELGPGQGSVGKTAPESGGQTCCSGGCAGHRCGAEP